MGAYPIGIVGESFKNDDGSSRQAEIKRCSSGEVVSLERDPENIYDANCVKVVSVRGVQIGNISRDDAWIAERLDRDGLVDAQILRIGAGAKGKLGVVICVRTTKDDEWLADEHQISTANTGCSAALLICLPTAAAFLNAVVR
jgi:hypothetical protein